MPDPPAFCEREDVRKIMQKSPALFGDKQLSDDIVDASIQGVSTWFGKQVDGYFYDSSAEPADLIDTTPASAEGIIKSVASSPHRQGGQVFKTARGAGQPRYPTTRDGHFVRVMLPALHVQTIDRLFVRDRGGGGEDWVASDDKTEGRDEDYYVTADGSTDYGVSYLYLRAASIGSRRSFTDLLTIDLTYGLDEQDTSWADVRRGVAALAAAQVIVDDDVIASLPDNGSLINVSTQHEQLRELGVASDVSALDHYMSAPVA